MECEQGRLSKERKDLDILFHTINSTFPLPFGSKTELISSFDSECVGCGDNLHYGKWLWGRMTTTDLSRLKSVKGNAIYNCTLQCGNGLVLERCDSARICSFSML